MNKELLLKVKQHILEEPMRLRMANWLVTPECTFLNGIEEISITGREVHFGGMSSYQEPEIQNFPACNTIGCIAGWTVVLGGGKYEGKDDLSIEDQATQLLGLSYREAGHLFYVGFWDEDFREAYRASETAQKRAEVVGEVIDRFILEHENV